MKKIVSVLLAVCLLAGFAMVGAVPAGASVPATRDWIDGTVVVCDDVRATGRHSVYIRRGGMLIVRGNLYYGGMYNLHIGGRILVGGDIVIVGEPQYAIVSGRSWMLHPAWQWVEQYLLFGWFWLWLC